MSEEKNNLNENLAQNEKNSTHMQQNEAEFGDHPIKNDENGLNNNKSGDKNFTAKIAELENKLSDTNDKLLRCLAELDNTRRRSREEIEKTAKYAVSNFASDLVLVVENFFLACDNAPKEKIAADADIKHFDDAIEMTRKELIKVLEKNQIKRIYPLSEKFDHNFHEAIAQIDSDQDEGTVAQVVQAGYKIGDRLIRPALVGVSKGKA